MNWAHIITSVALALVAIAAVYAYARRESSDLIAVAVLATLASCVAGG